MNINLMLAMGGNDAMLLALLVVGPLMAFYGVYQLVADLKAAPKRKIERRLRGRASNTPAAAKLTVDDLRRQGPKAVGALADWVSKFSATERLQRTLEQANINWNASQLLVNLTLIASITLALLVLVGVHVLIAIPIAACVYVLPIFYLVWKRKQRVLKLVNQLPDVFEPLSQALPAGHSLASGMQVVAIELSEPAGTEFGRVFQEQNLGLKIEDALANLADRMDVLDVRFFVTAVLIQRQTGGDLAEVLDKIGRLIRQRFELFGHVKALTAEGRLSGVVLLAMPPGLLTFLAVVNYDYVSVLFTTPTGVKMLSITAALQVVGAWMIKQIVAIKV